jgi:membrane protease YdiL (CAAX protease family)
MRSGIDFKPLLELMGLMVTGMLLSVLISQTLNLGGAELSNQNQTLRFLAFVVVSLLFTFGLPAFLWLRWRGALVSESDGISKNARDYVLSGLLFILMMLFSSYFMEWFSNFLELRGWSELVDEPFNIQAVRDLLKHKNFFLPTLIIVALVPGVVEELFFRRIIFRYLTKSSRSFWTPAILSSLFFSGMHNHFLSFIPIFLLGMALAFAYYITKNIWVSIALHSGNNALSIILLKLGYMDDLKVHWLLAMMSAFLIVTIFNHYRGQLSTSEN